MGTEEHMSATAIDVRYRRLFGYQAGYLPLDRGAVDSFLTDVKAKVTERQAKGVELRSPAVRALAKLLDENLALRHLVKDMIDEAEPKNFAAFRRSAGSWKGLVDAEKLIRDIYPHEVLRPRQGIVVTLPIFAQAGLF